MQVDTSASVQEEFFDYLMIGLEKGKLDSQYCKTAFSHFDRKSNGALSEYGYVESLEDFLVHLNQKTDSLSLQCADVMNLLRTAREIEPFASLPSEERRLMDQIQIHIYKGDTLNAANSLNELKQVILARHRVYERIDRQNAWSIPLAFVGIACTLTFGVWATILAIRKGRGKQSNTHGEPTIHN